MKTRIAIGIGLCMMLCMALAHADSWPSPRTKEYFSTDGTIRVIIVPRSLAGKFEYFRDKADGVNPAGQHAGSGVQHTFARLSRRAKDGSWITLWQQPLVNDVAPVDAMIAGKGKYLITFDNWHSMGHGDDAVVIYDARGRLIRKSALIDFLPQAYIDTLPASVSSIHWRGGHFLQDGGETLVLRVVEPSMGLGDDDGLTVSVRIRLADGSITPPAGRAWERALRKSKKTRAEQEAFTRKACAEWGGGWCKPRK